MRKKNKFKILCIWILSMLITLIYVNVFAQSQGSVTLKALADKDGESISLRNTEFVMYQVGEYRNGSWVLTAEFEKSGVIFDFQDSSRQKSEAKKLEEYTKKEKIAGKTGVTDMDGEVTFGNLEKGIYLFVQTKKTCTENQIYQSEPFILSVPEIYESQTIWDVTAEPKFNNESIPPIITKTPPVSEEPPENYTPITGNHAKKVKTGDNTDILIWIVLMGIAGAVLAFGKVLKVREQGREG